MSRAPILVEAARPKSLGPGVIHHDVRRDVPGEIGAVLESRFRASKVLRVEIVRERGRAAARQYARLVAAETRQDAPFVRVLEQEVARARGERQHLGYQVDVGRAEERGLFCFAWRVLIKRLTRRPDPRRVDRTPGERAQGGEAARGEGCGTFRYPLVAPRSPIGQFVVLVERAHDAAHAPIIRSAQAELLLKVLVLLARVPGSARREALRSQIE